MCERLAELREAMAAYAAGFDAALLSSADARLALEHAAAIEHIAATVKALAAARVADGSRWRQEGHRSAAHGLAKTTGSSVKDARDVLEVGRRLEDQAEVAAAARRGELSAAQTKAITDAATADPDAGRRLLERAAEGNLAELQDECARTKAAAGPDLERRRADIHARRRLRHYTDGEGEWHLRADGNPEDGAQVVAALTPIINQLFHQARTEGRQERPEAYAFDALVHLAREATTVDPTAAPADPATSPAYPASPPVDPTAAPADPATSPADPASPPADPATSPADPAGADSRRRQRRGAPVKLLIRIDYDTLMRGFPLEGEVCELVGYGPIAMSAVADLLDMGDPFIAAILTKGQALVGVAHLGRKPTAHQRSALEWLYPSCAVKGCPAQAHLEIDHRIDWAKTHYTLLDRLDRLCRFHHKLKTREGWQLIDGTGKRPFVPPDDPRHPQHHPPPTKDAAA